MKPASLSNKQAVAAAIVLHYFPVAVAAVGADGPGDALLISRSKVQCFLYTDRATASCCKAPKLVTIVLCAVLSLYTITMRSANIVLPVHHTSAWCSGQYGTSSGLSSAV